MIEKYFYRVTLLRSAAPDLIYHSHEKLEVGRIVLVPLRNKPRRAVVLEEVPRPDFETREISDTTIDYYRSEEIKSARFIASYYFSSMGEALGLFSPRRKCTRIQTPFSRDNLPDLPKLSYAQQVAYRRLSGLEVGTLFGVTGSGKTELYIHRIAEMLKEGKSSILLMPEIALTPQMEKRLRKYFGKRVAIWHSRLRKKRREEILEGVCKGEIRIIAGARSALFVPLENPGLIIVDEEHDDSYKAMTRPRYHARDLAVYLGKEWAAQVWLASATPSVGSFIRFPVVRLSVPYVQTKKIYRFVAGDTINEEIIRALEMNYRRGEQSLVFVPTRANFKYLWCESCGRTHQCPYCSVGMSLHRQRRYLRCHYCNFVEPIREECSYCGHAPLKSDRPGTREAIEIISEAIPGIRLEQFDKDSITTPGKLEKALARIEKGESDVIVGTQMLSKGHDYPNITLSIITGLDYLLGLGDYRAKERAVSLLHQIAGRSGRSRDATILIQSSREEFFRPFLENYEEFLKEESEFRRQCDYPPFTYLARILVADRNAKRGEEKIRKIVEQLQRLSAISIVGAGPSPVERIAGRYRYSILLRSIKRTSLLRALHGICESGVEIDMDPVDFS